MRFTFRCNGSNKVVDGSKKRRNNSEATTLSEKLMTYLEHLDYFSRATTNTETNAFKGKMVENTYIIPVKGLLDPTRLSSFNYK